MGVARTLVEVSSAGVHLAWQMLLSLAVVCEQEDCPRLPSFLSGFEPLQVHSLSSIFSEWERSVLF